MTDLHRRQLVLTLVVSPLVASPRLFAKELAMKSAKRRVPTPPAVTADGIRYEVDFGGRTRDLGQIGGVIAAVEEDSGTVLWRLVVYPVTFNPAKEEDTQEVFITALALDPTGRTLLVTNEADRHFAVDLEQRTITPR